MTKSNSSNSYSFYNANIELPRVRRLSPRSSAFSLSSNKSNQSLPTEIKKESSSCNSKSPSCIPEESTSIEMDNLSQDRVNFIPHPPTEIRKKKSVETPTLDKSELDLSIIATSNDTYLKPVDTVGYEQGDEGKKLIGMYKDFLSHRYGKKICDSSSVCNYESDKISTSSDDEFSISSLCSSDKDEEDSFLTNTTAPTEFEPLYSLPNKFKNAENFKKFQCNRHLNSIVLTKAKLGFDENCYTNSLPDLRTIDKFVLKKTSHVSKNESEAESEPGAKRVYKFRPLPPIPSSNLQNNSGLYETLDHQKERNEVNHEGNHKSFKQIAQMITLIPKLTTRSVRSRKSDHHLSELTNYLPNKKLTIFVGTWNMKGTKVKLVV